MLNIKTALVAASTLSLALAAEAFSASSLTYLSDRSAFTLTPAKPFKLDMTSETIVPPCRSIACGELLRPDESNRHDAGSITSPDQTSGGSHIPSLDELASEMPKNLRVYFIADSIENIIVSGDGALPSSDDISALGLWASWEFHSSAATLELYNDEVALPTPPPGELWPLYHYNLVYDALVLDGCGNTPVFPIEFDGEIFDVDNFNTVLGTITKFDGSTLIPNGYWNFSYSIRAADGVGGVSDYLFKGRVSVLCSNLESYL